MNREVKKVKLLAKKEGLYSLYLFQDLINNDFILCTKLPNWTIPFIEIGDEGFVQLETVIAGTKYFSSGEEIHVNYKYSNIYMINYLKETDIKNSNIIL